uniref:Uncharacterized protein n=1 Tax=Sinocyclocheilus rhinocerous TaxID=307959 RepID=A0A673JAM6_9TELE
MLSLNNKYFTGSIYTGMLWILGDVTEPFDVNFFASRTLRPCFYTVYGHAEINLISLSEIIERLTNKTLETPHDPYVSTDDTFWPPYTEMLLRNGIAKRHPEDCSKIHLENVFLNLKTSKTLFGNLRVTSRTLRPCFYTVYGHAEINLISLSEIIERLTNKTLETPHDPYVTTDDTCWPPYTEMLLCNGIATRHPEDCSKIHLENFFLNLKSTYLNLI